MVRQGCQIILQSFACQFKKWRGPRHSNKKPSSFPLNNQSRDLFWTSLHVRFSTWWGFHRCNHPNWCLMLLQNLKGLQIHRITCQITCQMTYYRHCECPIWSPDPFSLGMFGRIIVDRSTLIGRGCLCERKCLPQKLGRVTFNRLRQLQDLKE